LALRVGFVLLEQPGFYFEDSLDYDRAARSFLETGHFDARYYRFPLYPLVMAASYGVFGPTLTPLRIIQAIFGAATCLCIWVLGLFLYLWIFFGQTARSVGLRALAIIGVTSLVVLAPWLYVMKKSGDYRALVLRPGLHLPAAPGVNPPLWEGSGENLLMSKLSGLARNPWWTMHHAWTEFIHFWDPYPDRLASADKSFREKLHEQDARMVADNSLVGDLSQHVYAAGFSALLAIAVIGALVALRTVPGSGLLVSWP